MNIFDTISDQIVRIGQLADNHGLQSVLTHIERAGSLLETGKELQDDQYFNDVIYRTNQAYEGILKEAFEFLSKEEGNRKRLYDIEKYLSKEEVFSPRVLQLFQNYRREWRNESTHNYQLFFSDTEAFLAIISVTAFVHVLLNQILEELAAGIQEKALEDQPVVLSQERSLMEDPWAVQLGKAVQAFAQSPASTLDPDDAEAEMAGKLTAFFRASLPTLQVKRQPIFNLEDHQYTIDLILTDTNTQQQCAIDIKRGSGPIAASSLPSQMDTFLAKVGMEHGLVIVKGTGPVKDSDEALYFQTTSNRTVVLVKI